MDGAGFLTIQLLILMDGGGRGHKSCLLVHIRANTEHYFHRLKPDPVQQKRAQCLFCKQ